MSAIAICGHVEYPKRGMLFAVGNQAKRPQVWQLLGVLRVDDTANSAAILKWRSPAQFSRIFYALPLRTLSTVPQNPPPAGAMAP